MKQTSLIRTTVAVAAALALPDCLAAKPDGKTLEDLWKIIQQQQKEITELKAREHQNEETRKQLDQLTAETRKDPATGTSNSKDAETASDKKTGILASELEKLKTQLVIPESRQYKSQFGLGPAASQVYRINRGLSVGGYGEALYTNFVGDKGDAKDTFDLQRAVLYLGYKFNDWIILNNEIEFEHASTGEGDEEKGEVSVEFSQLDFLLHDAANIRAGLMLMPMGFINEMHEPTTFHGSRRPDVERYIIPTTWREMGAGLFGEPLPGLQYRVYAVNGLNAEEFSSEGIREGRQGGSKALAENFAVTGRIDYSPHFAPGLTIGASTYMGDASQEERYLGRKISAFTQLHEGHLQWRYKGLEFRTLGAWGHIDNADVLSAAKGETIGRDNYGWYTELAYDVMPLVWKDSSQYLAPFFRYERYDTLASVPAGFTDDPGFDRRIYQVGLTYKPISNIAIKADYRNIEAAGDPGAKRPDEFNLGIGFIY